MRIGTGLLVAVVGGLAGLLPIRATTTEQVVVDRYSGLAINGFDPVAYFVGAAAPAGKGDFEYAFAGAVWRFRNEGNRAAFMANPEVYMPRYGGYDPVGIALGVAVPGHPKLWTVWEKRLYLFYSADDQATFVPDAKRIITTADRKWPSVRNQLTP